VVAGRVNRESGEVQAIDAGGPILAQCWPRGSTSDPPQYMQLARAFARGMDQNRMPKAMLSLAAPALQAVVATAQRNVQQEQLGDLKLYRLPDRITVAARQSKQVRLLDRLGIPVKLVYGAELPVDEIILSAPASLRLRTMNTLANHLGLPLPSGRIAVFATRGGAKLLQHESGMRDLAVDEEVEIDLGDSSDVEVTAGIDRVDISNARPREIQFELRLRPPEGGRIVHADHALGTKNGRPIFRLKIPANETVTVRYHWQRPID